MSNDCYYFIYSNSSFDMLSFYLVTILSFSLFIHFVTVLQNTVAQGHFHIFTFIHKLYKKEEATFRKSKYGKV